MEKIKSLGALSQNQNVKLLDTEGNNLLAQVEAYKVATK